VKTFVTTESAGIPTSGPPYRSSTLQVNCYFNGTVLTPNRPRVDNYYDQYAIAVRGPSDQGPQDDTPYMQTDDKGNFFIGMAVDTTSNYTP
jgi:hypothetical protein